VDVGLYGSFRNLHDPGDIAVREVTDMSEDQCLLLAPWQLTDGGDQNPSIIEDLLEFAIPDHVELGNRLPLYEIKSEVGRDSEYPTLLPGLVPQFGPMRQTSGEGLDRDILGVLVISGN
jgi:hypothetical protein